MGYIGRLVVAVSLTAVALGSLEVASAPTAGSTGVGVPHPVTVHEEDLPPGISLHDPVDTASLYRRAGLSRTATPMRSARVAAGTTAGYVPAGSSGLPGLGSHVAPSCTGTGSDGRRVQVLYARETGDASRFTAMRAAFLNEIGNVDDIFAASAAREGAGLRVRWLTDSTCTPVLTEVVLPAGTLSASHSTLASTLAAKGFNNPLRKYLVFAEGNRLSHGTGVGTCGIGNYYQDSQPGPGNLNNGGTGLAPTVARVDAVCWLTSSQASASTHELIHTLGAVGSSAPHHTAYGHCTDATEVMCYVDGPDTVLHTACLLNQLDIDCGDDDYFNPAAPAGSYLATHWNIANSLFLDKVGTTPGIVITAPTATSIAASGAALAVVRVSVRAGSLAVPGAAITVWQRRYGATTWGVRTRVHADSAGNYSFRYTPIGGLQFRATTAAATTYRASSSGIATVRITPRLRNRLTASHRRTFASVTARTASGGVLRGVRLVLQAKATGRGWRTVGAATTGSTGVARLSQRARRGTTWYRWVKVGDRNIATGASNTVGVRRR